MPVTKDFDEHSKSLNWRDLTSVWTYIGNFWQMITDKSLVSVLHGAWALLANPLFKLVNYHIHDFSWDSDSYTLSNEDPVFIELTFDSSNATGNPNEYRLGAEWRNIIKLQDFINEPTIELYRYSGDYVITTAVSNKREGTITFASDNYATSMWAASYFYKRVEEIVGRFGVFVRYTSDWMDVNAREEVEAIKAIKTLAHTRQFGPVIPYMESGIMAIQDWVYCDTAGTILAIDGTTSITITTEDRGTIFLTNDTGLAFRHRTIGDTWADLVVGDTIIAYEPLVQAVVCDDRYSSPTWWWHRPVGELESWHTFYVGFNADLPIDTTSEGAETYNIDFSYGSTIWRYVRDNKKIGSKPYFVITWPWIPTGGIWATSLPNQSGFPEDTTSGIYDTSWTEPEGATSDIWATTIWLYPDGPTGDIWESSAFVDVLAPTGGVYYSGWDIEPLGPTGGIFGTLMLPGPGDGGIWGTSWEDTSGGGP